MIRAKSLFTYTSARSKGCDQLVGPRVLAAWPGGLDAAEIVLVAACDVLAGSFEAGAHAGRTSKGVDGVSVFPFGKDADGPALNGAGRSARGQECESEDVAQHDALRLTKVCLFGRLVEMKVKS